MQWPARVLTASAVTILATGCIAVQRQQGSASLAIDKQGSFAVGGQVLGDPDAKSLHCDHGYVDYQIPDVRGRRLRLSAG